MKNRFYAGAFVLGALLLVPSGVLAQDNDSRTTEQLVLDVERADQLFAEAVQLQADSKNWNKAAQRYVQSAEFRPYGDAKAFVALHQAGQLYSHGDKVRPARRAFAAAAIRALETGNVNGAAVAFANAAELGMRETDTGAGTRNLNYHRMAQRLSESPMLTESQQQSIRERLGLTS